MEAPFLGSAVGVEAETRCFFEESEPAESATRGALPLALLFTRARLEPSPLSSTSRYALLESSSDCSSILLASLWDLLYSLLAMPDSLARSLRLTDQDVAYFLMDANWKVLCSSN